MGNNTSQASKHKTPSLIITHMGDSKVPRTTSLKTIPLSLGAASLSCLAAEHNQIHDQESLNAWRTKALHTVDEFFEQKASHLRHEAHVSALLGQLRAIIDEEIPRQTNGYLMDNYQLQEIPPITNDMKE
ncbi:unnamed protein product [Rotaria socialis]|uniref:Uncharacterized protein n=1 Tax=Rotaria socialis TaxID=392032 RepID=A0A821BRY1_9BILA|nr:unnamed protein product [Rotaria socialis]CAF4599477.1 unnamed protein product [Rotaria socialis]